MAGNITGLHVFAADAGPEALSLLDGNFSPLVTAFNTLVNFNNYYSDAGPANALAITLTGVQVASLNAGLAVEVLVLNTNTSSIVTLNVNALGAKNVLMSDGAGPPVGSLIAGSVYRFTYDGTQFRLLNPTLPVADLTIKPGATSRTNTTVMTNDPDLQMILPAGVYAFDALLNCYNTGSTAPGFQLNLNFSGTFTSNFILLSMIENSPTAPYFTGFNVQTAPGNGPFALPQTVAGVNAIWPVRLTGGINITGTGTFAVAWSQNVSNANPSILGAVSWLQVTRTI
jgi:hypothetical protein